MPTTRSMSKEYTLLYWPGLPGRGEPIRLAFEEAGVEYNDTAKTSNGIDVMFKTRAEIPAFAPPMLKHGDVTLFQTPNIMYYLGPKLGLAPDDEIGRLEVSQLYLTMSDFQNEGHDSHHPISTALYYEDQKPEALKAAAAFRKHRIPIFFDFFESVLVKNERENKSEWVIGNKLTYADLMLFHVVEAAKYAYPRRIAALATKYPKLYALHARVAERPNIKAYLQSERREPFNQNGVWRHFPELDGED